MQRVKREWKEVKKSGVYGGVVALRAEGGGMTYAGDTVPLDDDSGAEGIQVVVTEVLLLGDHV